MKNKQGENAVGGRGPKRGTALTASPFSLYRVAGLLRWCRQALLNKGLLSVLNSVPTRTR